MNSAREIGNAQDAPSAVLIGGAEVAEHLPLRGVYTASCIGPVAEHQQRYEVQRQKLVDALGEERAIDLLRRDGPGIGKLPSPLSIVDLDSTTYLLLHELLSIEFEEKWQDRFKNVITTVGANEMLDKYFAGSAYTAAVVMGLKGTGAAAIGDTQASHATWSEVGGTNAPAYSGNRPAPAWAAASAKSKAVSPAVNFAFTSGGTVAGAFMNQGGSATKDNTTGTLVSAGDFTGGSKTVANTDQINVSWSISV